MLAPKTVVWLGVFYKYINNEGTIANKAAEEDEQKYW